MKHYEVVCALIFKDNKIFACQRGDYGECGLKWEFPGGKVEPGETNEDAIVREIREELSGVIKVIDYIGTINHLYNSFSITMHCYKCELVSDNLAISEHVDSLWIDEDKIKDLSLLDWAEADKKVISLL